jgi:cytochrome c
MWLRILQGHPAVTCPNLFRWPNLVHLRPLLACLLGVILPAGAGGPATAHTADEVQTLVERAAAHIQTVGPARAFADITRPDGGFVDGDLYVFCNTPDGIVLANGGNPRIVGKNIAGVRDAEGKQPILDGVRLALTQGHGWLEYRWPNMQTGRVQHKVTYVLRVDDRTVCGSGYYTADPP